MDFRPVHLLAACVVAGSFALGGCVSQPERPAGSGHVPATIAAKAGRPPKRRYDQPAEAQLHFMHKRLPAGATAIDGTWYVEAAREADLLPLYSSAIAAPLSDAEAAARGAELQWTPLGPGNIGGRTRVLQFHPDDPDIMYTAGVAGGVWKSIDGGASWMPMSDLIANLAVVSLAVDPSDGDVVFAGTGEGVFSGDSQRGAGIFRSVDGGANWSQLAATANSSFHYVNDLIIGPNSSNVLYAATRAGIFRSLDGGTSWSQQFAEPTGRGCFDLEARTDTAATDVVFAACGSFEGGQILRNEDAAGAGPWTTVLSPQGMARSSLSIAPSSQDVVYVLATCTTATGYNCGDFNNGLRGVFRSDDGGDSWDTQVDNNAPVRLNRVLLSNPVFAFLFDCGFGGANQFFNQGWYDIILKVDPVNPDRVWAGGVDLFRSDDGGLNWGIASYWWFNPASPSYVHADMHGLYFHPDYDAITETRLYSSNDGGLHVTANPNAAVASNTGDGLPGVCGQTGLPAITWSGLNNGYQVTQFYHGSVYPDQTTYFGGTQDNGTPRGNDGSGTNAWLELFGGDGGYTAVNPDNTQILYLETTGISIRRSLDGGASFQPATSGISDSGLFINPFTMDPNDPERLWTSGRFLWRTDDGADSWSRASVELTPGNVRISAHAVAPGNSDLVLAGASDGRIFRNTAATSADSSTPWSSVQPRSGYVSSIAFDPGDTSIAYATYSTFGGAHVWRSANGGVSWSALDGAGQLPDMPVHSIVVDPDNGQQLWIGTDLGVFVSNDGGGSWARENTGFANVFTEHLVLAGSDQSPPKQLFAFTHGRSLFKVALPEGDLVFRDGFE